MKKVEKALRKSRHLNEQQMKIHVEDLRVKNEELKSKVEQLTDKLEKLNKFVCKHTKREYIYNLVMVMISSFLKPCHPFYQGSYHFVSVVRTP